MSTSIDTFRDTCVDGSANGAGGPPILEACVENPLRRQALLNAYSGFNLEPWARVADPESGVQSLGHIRYTAKEPRPRGRAACRAVYGQALRSAETERKGHSGPCSRRGGPMSARTITRKRNQ